LKKDNWEMHCVTLCTVRKLQQLLSCCRNNWSCCSCYQCCHRTCWSYWKWYQCCYHAWKSWAERLNCWGSLWQVFLFRCRTHSKTRAAHSRDAVWRFVGSCYPGGGDWCWSMARQHCPH
jgi:hypothetical protein